MSLDEKIIAALEEISEDNEVARAVVVSIKALKNENGDGNLAVLEGTRCIVVAVDNGGDLMVKPIGLDVEVMLCSK